MTEAQQPPENDPTAAELDEPREPKADAQAVNEGGERFALYDTEHLRFVGPVSDTRPSASKIKDATKAAGGRKIEVRKV